LVAQAGRNGVNKSLIVNQNVV